jgi:DNA-binding IclR family transcriptional regulator
MPPTSEQGAYADQPGAGHRGVERIARILEAAAASPGGVRLIDAAKLLDAPRSSIHSLLKGLIGVGYLEERDGRYVIGKGLQALLAPHQTSWLVDLASDDVTRLSRDIGETTLLGIQAGDSIVYIFQAESSQSIHYTAKLGERRLLYPTSMGKLFLAAMGDHALSAFLRTHAGLDAARIQAELEQIRHDGVAYNREETVKGVTAVASPIIGRDGAPLAAISVVGPVYRMEDELPRAAEKVCSVAAKLSKRALARPYH